MEIDQNLQINLVSCLSKGFCTFVSMFFDLLPGTCSKYIFRVKFQLLTSELDQDPDGSIMVWLPGSGSAPRYKAVPQQ